MDLTALQVSGFIQSHLLALMSSLMLLCGFGLGYWWYGRTLNQTRLELERVQWQLQHATQHYAERLQQWEDSHSRQQQAFASVSEQALRHNNSQFLQLAQETLGRFQVESQADLTQRQHSIQFLVQPIQQALEKTELQIRQIEKERQASFGVLSEQIRAMLHDQMALRTETGRLAMALRTPSLKGQWGELSLRRIVELAGMNAHCDFQEQVLKTDGERTIRPDLIIRMPDARELIIDAKAPMDAYLDAVHAESATQRKAHLQRYVKQVREHIRHLAAKRYWEQFEQAPDFVVLFIPSEAFLSAALDQDKNLLEDALNDKVILATPTTLIALLRAVAYGWKQTLLGQNARKVKSLGDELHKRVSIFAEHMDKLGRSLGTSVETYNKALGSLERNVMPGMRRLAEMGISSGRELTDLAPIETVPRAPYISSKQRRTQVELDQSSTSQSND